MVSVAWRLSDRASRSIAATLPALAIIGASLKLLHALANCRANERAMSNVFSVFSNFQRVPSQCSHEPHWWQ